MIVLRWISKHYLVSSCFVLLVGAFIFEESIKEESHANVLLYGVREAPIGGEYVKLYDNDSIEFGVFAVRTSKAVVAKYHLEGDTIKIHYGENDTLRKDDWLIVRRDILERKSGGPFKIGQNNLGEAKPTAE